MEEKWKDVKGFEGLYQVSNHGRIKSLPKFVAYSNGKCYFYAEKILRPCKNQKGYLKIGLSKNDSYKSLYVHRLVAEAFIPNTHNRKQVNHIDENKENNYASNLEWCDCQYNVDYSISKKVRQYDMQGNLLHVWKSIIEARRRTGVADANIIACCKGKYGQAGGYVWRYDEDGKAVIA